MKAMDVFNAFPTTSYTFLQVSRGGVRGNVIEDQFEATGIYKLRSNMVVGTDEETKRSNATLHVRPTETFIAANNNNLIGHGIRVGFIDYEIIGQTGGKDYHTNTLEHYTVTLQETDFSDYSQSS